MPRPKRELTVACQVYLRPDQIEALDELAAQQGISRAELLRQMVDAHLKPR
jgi:hypothetical protein